MAAAPSDLYQKTALQYLDKGLLPIPARSGSKAPLVAHKPRKNDSGPLWTREIARQNLNNFKDTNFGVLCDTLFVIDFDDQASYDNWYARFKKEFDATVLCRTRKGFHVWFQRTKECDDLNLTDGALGFERLTDGSKGPKLPTDIKTRSAAGVKLKLPDGTFQMYYTPGFLSVPPSKNKTWVRSPFEHEIQPVPRIILDYVVDCKAKAWKPTGATGKRKRSESLTNKETAVVTTAAASETQIVSTTNSTALPFWRPRMDLMKPDLSKLGFDVKRIFSVCEYSSLNANMLSANYVNGILQFKYDGPCPLCGKKPKHDNSFWLGFKADGSRRTRAPTCLKDFAAEVPWTKSGLNVWLKEFVRDRDGDVPAELIERLKKDFKFLKHVNSSASKMKDGVYYLNVGDSWWVLDTRIAHRVHGFAVLKEIGTRPWIEGNVISKIPIAISI